MHRVRFYVFIYPYEIGLVFLSQHTPNGKHPLSLQRNFCFMKFSFASHDSISTKIYTCSIFALLHSRDKERSDTHKKIPDSMKIKKIKGIEEQTGSAILLKIIHF